MIPLEVKFKRIILRLIKTNNFLSIGIIVEGLQ
jgi:hypothetical protein